MNDEQLRKLHEYCGLKWKEKAHTGAVRTAGGSWKCSCGRVFCAIHGLRCHQGLNNVTTHPFTTPADKEALALAISEKGEWESFEEYCVHNQWQWRKDLGFTEWLMTLPAEEFCGLVCKWKGWE